MPKSAEKQPAENLKAWLRTPLDIYREDKFFYRLQAILLTTAMCVVNTLEKDIEIVELPQTTQHLTTITLPEKETSDVTSSKGDVSSTPESKSNADESVDSATQNPEETIENQNSKAFEEKLSKNFASDRQKLIDKYQSHFDTASITSELFEEFLFEYSSALETAIQKTKRDLGENELSDDEIRTKVQENQKDLEELLDRSVSIVRRSEDKAMAISGIIKNGIEYNASQASVNGMFNTETPQGNCVTRAIIASAIALKVGEKGVGFALMPGHIAAVSTNQDKVAVMDTVFKRVSAYKAGALVQGGRMLASLLAVTPNSSEESNSTRGGNDNSAYGGLSPTGPNSQLRTPPRPKPQTESNILTDDDYKALSIKYARDLSDLGDKEIQEEIKTSTEMIEDEKLRTELLGRLLQAASKGLSHRDFWDASNEITADMARKVRSNFSNPERISVKEALEKSDLVRGLSQLTNIGSYKITPLTIESLNEEQNRQIKSSDLGDSFSLVYKPYTLRGLQGVIETVDIANLQNLQELTGESEENQSDKQPMVDYYPSVEEYKEETEESKPLQIIHIHTYSSQLAALSSLDLSDSQSIFGIFKPLKEVDLEKLNGFSGIINFAIDKSVDLSILERIDLSKAKIALDYRLMVKELLKQKVDTLMIEDESNLRYLIEHNILQDMQSKLLIIKVDSSQKEFLRLAKETANSPHLNPGTNVRIELF